jgi:muconate cycloisomerase
MRIEQIELVDVVVPARAGAVNSASLDKPLHKMASGIDAAWTRQFDEFVKTIVIATTDDGTIGYGESLRDPDPEVMTAMARRLIGTDPRRLAWQQLPVGRTREYDAFELLVIDLQGKAAGVPASTVLGGALRDAVHVGAWSGHRTASDAAEIAAEAVSGGASTLKLKCELEDDVVGIAEAVRRRCGDAITLIFDPNERFHELRHATRIAKGLERVGNVLCLEDPLPRWDLAAYRELRSRTTVPIAVHVALGYGAHGQRISDVTRSITERAADVLNLSAGISDFLRMAHIADGAQLPYWHGSEIDLGIMEAGAVHAAAASAGATLPSDIFGRRIRETDLLVEPLEVSGAQVRVPAGHGLGVEVDPALLARYTVYRTTITEPAAA